MRLGGFVPCSLSDFPGRIASVVFTQGCNWRCPWCHNPALVYPDQFGAPLDESEILARLAARRQRLDGVVVSGGEPTLQRDLPEFLARVTALGLQAKLDTNGSQPRVVGALIEAGLLDFVAVDLKAPWARYAEAVGTDVSTEAIQETIDLLRSSGIEHQLRTTRWRSFTSAEEAEISGIAAGSPHVWQDMVGRTPAGPSSVQ